jgi:hypothetical protein
MSRAIVSARTELSRAGLIGSETFNQRDNKKAADIAAGRKGLGESRQKEAI